MHEEAVEAAIEAACRTREYHAFKRPDIRNAIVAFLRAWRPSRDAWAEAQAAHLMQSDANEELMRQNKPVLVGSSEALFLAVKLATATELESEGAPTP